MLELICFFRKRPAMTTDGLMDYYENQHSQLARKMGAAHAIPSALRYARRHLVPAKNPIAGQIRYGDDG